MEFSGYGSVGQQTERTADSYIIRIRVKLDDTRDEMMGIDNEDSH